MPMATKFGRVVACHEELPPMKSSEPLITWSCEITRKTKSIISPLTIPIVTKLGRVLNYYLRLPPLMSSDLLIT